jgi:hypothetical protein
VKQFSLRYKRLLTEEEFRVLVHTTLPNKAASPAKGVQTAV